MSGKTFGGPRADREKLGNHSVAALQGTKRIAAWQSWGKDWKSESRKQHYKEEEMCVERARRMRLRTLLCSLAMVVLSLGLAGVAAAQTASAPTPDCPPEKWSRCAGLYKLAVTTCGSVFEVPETAPICGFGLTVFLLECPPSSPCFEQVVVWDQICPIIKAVDKLDCNAISGGVFREHCLVEPAPTVPVGGRCKCNGECLSNVHDFGACGRPEAGTDTLECCASGRNGMYAGYYYCYGMENGTPCWSDAMCASHYCADNWDGIKKGKCKPHDVWNWDKGKPPPTSLVDSMGAVVVDGGRPYVFVEGSDGNLWSYWWDGHGWQWFNHKTPLDVSLAGSMGAAVVYDADENRPYVFVKGSDGQLWLHWYTSKGWQWGPHGTPDKNVSIAESMGTVVVHDAGENRPYVFVKGSDGQLWLRWYTSKGWQWGPHGTPDKNVSIAEPMGAIVVHDGEDRPYVFVKGSDGNLWQRWWDRHGWHWTNMKKPPDVSLAASMGAVVVDDKRPYVFVKGSDGNLWSNWWNGTLWQWFTSKQETPANVSLADSMGAMVVDGGRPYVFVKGSDGNLWSHWWDGHGWHWFNHETPLDVSLADSMGAVVVDGGRPYVFVKGSDGNLWMRWWQD